MVYKCEMKTAATQACYALKCIATSVHLYNHPAASLMQLCSQSIDFVCLLSCMKEFV